MKPYSDSLLLSYDLPLVDNHNYGEKSKRYDDRCVYGWPATPGRYRRVEEGGAVDVWDFMRKVCRTTFYARSPYPRRTRVIYDGQGSVEKLEKERAKLIRNAREHDRDYPHDMWMVLRFDYGEDGPIVEFYNTIEAILFKYLWGACYFEVTKAGMVRLIKENQIVRIFHMTPKGIEVYRSMALHPFTADEFKQNLYMLTRLLVNKGLVFNPGDRFLMYRGKDYGYANEGTLRNYNKRKNNDTEQTPAHSD